MILTCRQLVERVTDAEEGALSTADRLAWRAHLAWCRDCQAYVAQMKGVAVVARALGSERAPGAAPEAVRRAAIDALSARVAVVGPTREK